jgi:hypothetical protein
VRDKVWDEVRHDVKDTVLKMMWEMKDTWRERWSIWDDEELKWKWCGESDAVRDEVRHDVKDKVKKDELRRCERWWIESAKSG